MAHPPAPPDHPYEGWTIKELREEVRRLRATAFSSQENSRTGPLPPPTVSSVSSLPGPDLALKQRRPPRRYRRTVSSTTPPTPDPASPSDLQDYAHHLGKRLEEVLISLRDVSLRFLNHGDENEVSNIMDAALNIVASFCDAIRIPEAFKTVAIAEVPMPRIDPEYNLLYLQFKSSLEVEGENREILLCFDDYTICPLSSKDVTKILQPVRSITCGHIYEQSSIMLYVGSSVKECPVTGAVSKDLVFEDAELRHDILAAAEEKRKEQMGAGQKAQYVEELVTV